MPDVLPELALNDRVRLRKAHPCGGYDWIVVRIGADIGLVCTTCNRRMLLPRRKLARSLKEVLTEEDPQDLDKDLSQI